MTHDHKTGAGENADRVIEWLLQHQTEFESQGIEEQGLATTIGLPEDKLREAVDYLENHEYVARLPKELTTPPRFLLEPARGWPEIVEKRAGTGPSR